MNHISLENQPEAVRQFVLALSVTPDGAVLELGGEPIACVFSPTKATNGDASHSEKWSEAKNDRRCELIDRKYFCSLPPLEEAELAVLQEQMLQFRQHVAPLPIADARRLHQELMMKAEHESTGN